MKEILGRAAAASAPIMCMVQLDEDEMEGFLRFTVRDCPYFQLDDEYAVVRKQN